MFLYRVEHFDTAEGPYGGPGSGNYTPIEDWEEDLSSQKHPLPSQDPLLKGPWKNLWNKHENYNWFFAFESLEQLLRWFSSPKGRDALEYDGYVVAKYEVKYKKYRHIGETQAIFHIKNAKRVATFSIGDL